MSYHSLSINLALLTGFKLGFIFWGNFKSLQPDD